ncbi:pirin family protein [Marinihelvus fidelis]|uniref:Pirin family protein n=1 Tax=Marinihelvus fidelis TaxID=2613842 RepID=A0A5N0TCE6_9GAMM|nr:pirin family protein [Marinihelvus fidelis]KAA9132702.1 pirin family protein [Marinihelvus fidelis]
MSDTGNRPLARVIPAMATSDGAGVKLRRSIGANGGHRLDPFLMLDEFGTDNPQDYIAGFPPHPHRGFETVTYMIDGHMRHEDHLGNVGELKSGGVQWMTAGRGVIHSEMPQQDSGRMRGFQLWINLPAKDKMQPAAYRDVPADDIPLLSLGDGVTAKLIAGRLAVGGQTTAGPINAEPGAMATDPLMADFTLPAGTATTVPVPEGHHAFVYVYEGGVLVDDQPLAMRQAGILGDGARLSLEAGAEDSRVLLVAGRPLGEPVVQYGPFVMNTREEIDQALADYRAGVLTG